jgi:hypothetical protein
VLEKALLLQRTLLTGKKEPNVAANQLAVEAVNHESDTLDQEIRNLKTELELRRELANNSPMAIIQRHGTRAAGSRGIYEGDPVPDRLDRLQKGNPGGNHERGAWLRPRWLFSRRAAKALLWRWCSSPPPWAPTSSASTSSAALPAGSGGWRPRGLLPGVAAVPVRRDGLRLGLDASPAAGARGRAQARRACCAARSPASSPSWRWKPAC